MSCPHSNGAQTLLHRRLQHVAQLLQQTKAAIHLGVATETGLLALLTWEGAKLE